MVCVCVASSLDSRSVAPDVIALVTRRSPCTWRSDSHTGLTSGADCYLQLTCYVPVQVTGAASGIGRAAAVMLANNGASVVAVDRDWDGKHVVAGEIGVGHIVQLSADVGDVDVRRSRLRAEC